MALENAEKLVSEYDMLPSGSRVLCAVSGGADSVCLLHWLLHRGDISLAAAHFNHQLRGAESDGDEAFVRSLCGEWGVPFTVGRGDVGAFARREKRSVEEAARTLRYTFLYRAAEEMGCDRIAVAHNASDNAETVLLNLLRGSGLNGLTGISPRCHKLVRPLLTTSRQEIEDYLARNRLPHVEDSSNSDDAYTRNRVRHQLIPLLEEMNPGFVHRLCSAIPRLRSDNDCLNAQAQQLFRQAVRRGEDLAIPAALIAGSPQPIAVRVVRQLIARFTGGCQDCAAAHLEDVVELCRREKPSARVCLPHDLTVRREYGELIFTHDPDPEPLEGFVPVRGDNPVPGTDWTLRLGGEPWPGLEVRPRRTGDELALRGRPRRSVKKLFIDEKVPRRERERIPVLADGDGVVAVAGFGPNAAHPRYGDVELEFVRS